MMRWTSTFRRMSTPRVGLRRGSGRGASWPAILAMTTFCWSAPRVPDKLSTRRADLELLGCIAWQACAPSSGARSCRGNRRARMGRRDVVRDREVHDEPSWWPVPRDVRDPARSAADASAKWTGRPSRRTSPAVGWAMPKRTRAISVRPAPTRPDMPRISPARTVKLIDQRNSPARVSPALRAGPSQWRPVPGKSVTDRPPCGGSGRTVVSSRVTAGDHVATVAEDRWPVVSWKDLVRAMADEEDGHPAGPAADDREQALHSWAESEAVARRGSGPASMDKRLGDLDQLLVGHRQAPDRGADVEPDVQLREERAAARRISRHEIAPRRPLGGLARKTSRQPTGPGKGGAPGARRRPVRSGGHRIEDLGRDAVEEDRARIGTCTPARS